MEEQIVKENIPAVEESKHNKILPSGEALTFEETYAITAREKNKLIILAGPSDSGKTTLVTTLYQMFQRGPLGDFYFGGSQTLNAFEQRAFHTRINSKRSEATTTKTRRGEFDALLHIRLWNCLENKICNLIVSDFSGEDYSSSIANVEVMKNDFVIIKRANVIVFLIDGDLISNKRYRHSVVKNALELFRTMHDADLLRRQVAIEVVITKYDIVKSRCKDNPSIDNYIKELTNKFKDQAANFSHDVRFFEISAMPAEISNIAIGYGIKKLLDSWMDSTNTVNSDEIDLKRSLNSEFNRYQYKVMG